MRNILKWIGYTILIIFLLIIIAIVFISNSSKLVEWGADTFAPKYGFSYNKVSGSLFTGVEVYKLKFKDRDILEEFNFSWNPATLFYKRLSITNIEIIGANIDNIKYISNSFTSSKSDDSKQNKEKSEYKIPISIGLDNIHINIKPFIQDNIKIEDLSLETDGIVYDGSISVNKFKLIADTNLANIKLIGNLYNRKVEIINLSIKDIDVLTLMALFKNKEDKNNTNQQSKFMPKTLIIHSLKTTTKPFEYNPVMVKSSQIDAKDILVDITNQIVNRGDFNISVDSNLSTINYNAKIIDNKIQSEGVVTPLKALFEIYKIPLRDNALLPIKINLNGDKDKIDGHIYLVGNKLLDVNNSEFNIDSINVINKIKYNIKNNSLKVINEGNISTPYAKNIYFCNTLTLVNELLDYNGSILLNKFKVKGLEDIDKNITTLIQDLNLSYSGDKSSIKAFIDSSFIKGKFISDDFKTADFNLYTKENIKIQEASIGFNLSIPIDFNNTMPLNIKADVNSNVVNMQSKIVYNNEINIESIIDIPKKSIIRDLDKNLNLSGFTPLKINANIDEVIKANIFAKIINADIKFNHKSNDIEGLIVLNSEEFKFNGNIDKKIMLDKDISSIEKFIKNMQQIYKFEVPKIIGDAKLSLAVENKKDLKIDLSSKELILKVDRKTNHRVDDTKISLEFIDGNLTLNSYQTTFQKQKIFSTKPSLINIKESIIRISPLWINDEIKVMGIYNLKDKKGDISAYANPLSISHKMINLKSIINLKTKIKENDTTIRGDITLLGGRVYFDTDKKTFASDKDILIIQEIKPKNDKKGKKESSIDLLLNIYTKKSLVYKNSSADIKVNPNLVIHQTYGSPLQVLGSIEIKDGSYYNFQNKKFTTKDSIIAFYGDPKNPTLDISAIYNSVNYEITIRITGNPNTPNIIFSSIPKLTKEQILSVILFDNEDAGNSSSGNDMMKMMGGAIAKSALSGVGVKIDHLSLGSDGSMEIGKKISDKVTIIYVNDEVSSARLEYDWSKNIKSSISSNGESSGADIVFRKEF